MKIATTCWKRAKRNKMPEVEAQNKDNAVDLHTRGEYSPSDVLKTANQVADTIVTGVKDLLSQNLSIKQTANDLLGGSNPYFTATERVCATNGGGTQRDTMSPTTTGPVVTSQQSAIGSTKGMFLGKAANETGGTEKF